MGWRGVGGFKEFVTDTFTVSESVRELLYNHYNVLPRYLGCMNVSLYVAYSDIFIHPKPRQKAFLEKVTTSQTLRNVHVAISVPQNKEENGSKMADYLETVGSNNETNPLRKIWVTLPG